MARGASVDDLLWAKKYKYSASGTNQKPPAHAEGTQGNRKNDKFSSKIPENGQNIEKFRR